MKRSSTLQRITRETQIELTLDLDPEFTQPEQVNRIETGLPLFDHFLQAMTFHGGLSVALTVRGDLEVDDHHTIEDCGIALGQAWRKALRESPPIVRFAHAYAPLDESLARAVVDVSGRACPVIDLALVRPHIGAVATENLTHFFQSFANAAQIALHVDVLRGANDHHRAEAAFKATGLALGQASRLSDRNRVPSTKGVLA